MWMIRRIALALAALSTIGIVTGETAPLRLDAETFISRFNAVAAEIGSPYTIARMKCYGRRDYRDCNLVISGAHIFGNLKVLPSKQINTLAFHVPREPEPDSGDTKTADPRPIFTAMVGALAPSLAAKARDSFVDAMFERRAKGEDAEQIAAEVQFALTADTEGLWLAARQAPGH